MDTIEARNVLRQFLARYRQIPYAVLAARVNEFDKEIVARQGGGFWQLQADFFWDDALRGNVRVMAAIDDGGLSACVPITDSFIKSPNDLFIGE